MDALSTAHPKKIAFEANFSKKHWSQKLSEIFLGSLICPLQKINDIEPLSLTLHGISWHFIKQPPKVKITKSAIVWTVGTIFKNEKKNLGEYYFTPLYLFMSQNSLYPMCDGSSTFYFFKIGIWGILFFTFLLVYEPKFLKPYVWQLEHILFFSKFGTKRPLKRPRGQIPKIPK